MCFIDTIDEKAATGEVKALYDAVRKNYGTLQSWALPFSHRPDVMRAWSRLIGTVSSHLDPRTYELVTVAAARAIQHSGCTLAHAERLPDLGFDPHQLAALARRDHAAAGLSPAEIALMDYAEAVATRAHTITQADIDHLRGLGVSDTEIFDAASVAAARCFFSKLLDAIGLSPDAGSGAALDPVVRRQLTVGRPIANTPSP